MPREKAVVLSDSGNNLAGETARETVRESNGVREVIREVTREFRQLSVG